MNIYHGTKFYQSVYELSELPESLAEVAFLGRSNSGKSSTINTLVQQTGLAKTSKTPGRTQLINFFTIIPNKFLVDLPGYGFAKVSSKIKKHWGTSLTLYLEQREPLRGVVLIMDIRHPLKEQDWQTINWLTHHKIPVHILLSKADKLSKSAAQTTLNKVLDATCHQPLVSVQVFSSLKAQGPQELSEKLNTWLEINSLSK